MGWFFKEVSPDEKGLIQASEDYLKNNKNSKVISYDRDDNGEIACVVIKDDETEDN